MNDNKPDVNATKVKLNSNDLFERKGQCTGTELSPSR